MAGPSLAHNPRGSSTLSREDPCRRPPGEVSSHRPRLAKTLLARRPPPACGGRAGGPGCSEPVSTQTRATTRYPSRRPTTTCTSPSTSTTSATAPRPTCWRSTVPPSRACRPGPGRTPRAPPKAPSCRGTATPQGAHRRSTHSQVPPQGEGGPGPGGHAPNLSAAEAPRDPPTHPPRDHRGTPSPAVLSSGRIQELPQSLLDRFKSICQKYGIGPQNIIYLGNKGRACGLLGGAAATPAQQGLGTGPH